MARTPEGQATLLAYGIHATPEQGATASQSVPQMAGLPTNSLEIKNHMLSFALRTHRLPSKLRRRNLRNSNDVSDTSKDSCFDMIQRGYSEPANRVGSINLFTGINVAGLAGILVALFFALLVHSVSAPDLHKVVAVDLPRVQNAAWQPKALREDVMWIVVTRDGGLFFRHNRIQINEIPDLIRAAVHDGSEKKVYLSVDTHSRHAEVKVVLEQIRLASVSNVVFLAEESIRS